MTIPKSLERRLRTFAPVISEIFAKNGWSHAGRDTTAVEMYFFVTELVETLLDKSLDEIESGRILVKYIEPDELDVYVNVFGWSAEEENFGD